MPKRAQITEEDINQYFDNLEESLKDVPASNIFNYDETNVTDDPGSRKRIFKQGVKYPERIMPHSKTLISLMFCGSANGVLLPIYTVYRAENMWTTWAEGGPPGSRYNRTNHGWFDALTFCDWFKQLFLPHAKLLDGKKILIGDNLGSHFSPELVQLAQDNNINFVYLPPNATHVAQPLDVAVFGPIKKLWRHILTEWRSTSLTGAAGLPKDQFPRLLSNLWDEAHKEGAISKNLQAGFKATGIVPLDRSNVINKIKKDQDYGTGSCNISTSSNVSDQQVINDTVVEYFKNVRFGNKRQKERKGRSL